MPRRALGPRLYLRTKQGQAPYYEIRDTGQRPVSTGTSCRREAETALAAYIERKYRPSGPTAPHDMSVSMALTIYAEEHAPHVAAPERIGYAISALDDFWKDMPVSAVTGATCRRYAKHRGKADGTIRRELGTLQAAINHCHREGYLTAAPVVALPQKPEARARWLTRQEAAWLIRAARNLRKDGRHLQWFILCGLYTGRRKATILSLHIDTPSLSGGHVDTAAGILYGKAQGRSETSKRKGTARLPARYLAHLRRQALNGQKYVVQDYAGGRVGDIRKGWDRAVRLAEEMARTKGVILDLSDVTPHTLKHTAITWAMQRGASIPDAASFFATSAATIERTYWHHSPDCQRSAVEAMDRRA